MVRIFGDKMNCCWKLYWEDSTLLQSRFQSHVYCSFDSTLCWYSFVLIWSLIQVSPSGYGIQVHSIFWIFWIFLYCWKPIHHILTNIYHLLINSLATGKIEIHLINAISRNEIHFKNMQCNRASERIFWIRAQLQNRSSHNAYVHPLNSLLQCKLDGYNEIKIMCCILNAAHDGY